MAPNVPSLPKDAQPDESVLSHAQAAKWIQDQTGFSEERIAYLLGITRMTFRNWKAGAAITAAHRQRLFETKDVLERAMQQHSRRDELVAWLETPDLIEGTTPANLLHNGNINRARLLAVLSPTSVVQTPAWARGPLPEAWGDVLEHPELPGEFSHERV